MISELLQKARDFEAKYGPFIPDEQRPAFHMTPSIGWMNDPNGFSVYRGEYHLFYQYHPYDNKWGSMHWGHVKTKDFIRWERLPAALAPDMPYDKDGCFSGGALELPDGRQLLMYTGVRQVREPNGEVRDFQTQCLALGDGIDYEKLEGNPVITAEDLPEGGSPHDFRDPKIWREGDTFYALMGNRPADGSGSVLLYESTDLQHWRFDGVLAACHNQYGRMWECPDFFELDGKHVLLVSPQEMNPIGLEFHAGNGTACIIGSYDRRRHHQIRETVQAIDYGLDFYAPQTLEAIDGRRIMIAWMQNWETTNCQPRGIRYFGEMTVPRELSLRDGRLIQNPVRELENYRSYQILYKNVVFSGTTSLQNVKGRVLDMTVSVRPAVENGTYRWFKINVARDGEHYVTVRYKPENNTVRIDRSHSGFSHDIVCVRDFLVRPRQGEIKLRLILDRHSLELFVNDGEQAATAMLYTDLNADAISFEVDGCIAMDVEKYDLVFDRGAEA